MSSIHPNDYGLSCCGPNLISGGDVDAKDKDEAGGFRPGFIAKTALRYSAERLDEWPPPGGMRCQTI
jgi:hypothetical protein